MVIDALMTARGFLGGNMSESLMSVTIRKTCRNSFGTTVPVLTPLYNAGCDVWQIGDEGEFLCGSSERCAFRLCIDGIEEQHCTLLFRSGLLRIRSHSGRVWVNDLPASHETDLSPGDIISIGPISFEIGQTVRLSEPDPASLSMERSSPVICSVTSTSQETGSEWPCSGLSRSTAAIETASVLVRESVDVASTLLAQLEGQRHAIELRERKCQEDAQATELREAAIRDSEQRMQQRHEELTLRSSELEALAAELSDQKRRMESAIAASRQEAANQPDSQSMEQLAAIASERESLLLAREEAIQSLADMRNQTAALNLQESRLQAWQADLELRNAELIRRTAELQQQEDELSAKEAQHLAAITAETSEQQKLTKSLLESEKHCDDLVQERDALLTAVSKLKSALENARSDVEQASRIQAESAAQKQILAQLYQTIEDSANQLTMKDSQLVRTNEELHTVKAQVAALTEERDELNRLRAAAAVSRESESGADDETERQLLEELESLRDEISQRASEEQTRQSETESELRGTLAKRDHQIAELQTEIESLREQVESLLVTASHETELAEIERLRRQIETSDEQIRERDALIRELRTRLSQPSPPLVDNYNQERIQNESRELDRRAALLDQRDEELRERCRQIDQSEEDIEIQRRQLLEARQQLEQARAEIQVAIRQHSASAPNPAHAEFASKSVGFGDHSQHFGGALPFDEASLSVVGCSKEETQTADHSPAENDLRFELAGLFGLNKPHDEPAAQPVAPAQDFIDLSEPAGESRAVAFHFGEDASSFIQSFLPDSASNSTVDSPREENSDDFVRDYMEQLLSRSRKSAGNALPEELKPAGASEKKTGGPDARRTTASTEVSAPKSPPKVRSFIDQYMSGDFGDLTGDGSITATPAAVSEESSTNPESQNNEPRAPRAKIDLQKMRENMDSLRTLSTQSVEQALVTHALRKERHHLNGRIMLALVLMGMSMFLAVANSRGIIDHPSLTWLTLVAAIGAAIELGRKRYGMKGRCKGVLASGDIQDSSCQDPSSEANACVSRHAFTPAAEGSEAPEVSADPEELPPHPDLPDRPRTTISNEAERSSRYFEL